LHRLISETEKEELLIIMAVRGVYSEAERKMIDDTNRKMDEMTGWIKFPSRITTEESIQSMAFAVDRWNPLWRDNDYAAGTRWGGIIAFPMYVDRFGSGGLGSMPAVPECGFQHMIWIGEDWEFFRPVSVHDSFRVYRRRPQLKDVTNPEGKGPRTFGLLEVDRDHINQKDEIVSRAKLYVQRTFLPGPPDPYAMPEYSYTREELLFIDSMIREEEIRGANARYWEDVEIGDMTKPVVGGPTSMADNAIVNTIAPSVGSRSVLREVFIKSVGGELGDEFIPDKTTGRYHLRGGPAGRHWSDRAAQAEGEPCAFMFGVFSRFLMARLITNWMGDDGFLRKYNWRHITRTPVGDAMIGRGKVVNKYVKNGEHMVDLVVWLENMRGNVSEAATATVSLISREAPLTWK